MQPTLPSASCTMHAKNAVLYCKSRTPRLLRPVTPPLIPPVAAFAPLLLASRISSALFPPGSPSWLTSGTTMNVPVNTHLSPAFARSTSSDRRITSRDRGIEPVGISEGFSWMRTFCQSVNLEVSICSCHAMRLPQVGLGHKLGCASNNQRGIGYTNNDVIPRYT